MIYFIRDRASRAVKIGTARNVPLRLASLQTGCANPLEVLGTMPGDATQEALLHDLFADRRLRGEWFSDDPDVLAMIRRLILFGGQARTVEDENRARGGCRSGLRNLDVAWLDCVGVTMRIYASRWDRDSKLVLSLYPANGEPPRTLYRPGARIGLTVRGSDIQGVHWPDGAEQDVSASRCVLLSDWPYRCCGPVQNDCIS